MQTHILEDVLSTDKITGTELQNINVGNQIFNYQTLPLLTAFNIIKNVCR
jgi:hypothetical protein